MVRLVRLHPELPWLRFINVNPQIEVNSLFLFPDATFRVNVIPREN
jgi:hypothetical protein